MSDPRSLDERITRLAPGVDAALRDDMTQALRTLRRAESPAAAVTMMSRAALRLFRLIYAAAGRPWPGDNLYDVIVRAAKGDAEKRVDGHHILPDALDSPLHALRVLSNKVDHCVEQFRVGPELAESVLNALLGVMGWYYREAEAGPRLPSLYAERGGGWEIVPFTLVLPGKTWTR